MEGESNLVKICYALGHALLCRAPVHRISIYGIDITKSLFNNFIEITPVPLNLFLKMVYNSVVSGIFTEFATITTNSRTFSSLQKETLWLLAVTSYRPWQPLICFLSLRICLFWIFHLNGIIQCVAFCDWLLLL